MSLYYQNDYDHKICLDLTQSLVIIWQIYIKYYAKEKREREREKKNELNYFVVLI